MDMAAQLCGLKERHPVWAKITGLNARTPQHQNIDPVIGQPVMPQWLDDLTFKIAAVPWLEPAQFSPLQIGNDLVFYFLIIVFFPWLFLLFQSRLRIQPD